MIEAHLADGTKLEFPDGTPEDVIQRVVKQQTAQAPAAESSRRPYSPGDTRPIPMAMPFGANEPRLATAAQMPKMADDLMRATASGITGGYADEIAAKASEAIGQGTYAENVAAERERDKQIPAGLAIPGELAGAIMGTVAAPQLAPGRVAALGAKVPALAKAVGLGAGYGGLYGSGTAEEGGRLAGAGEGAAYGAVTGGALHGAMAGGRGIARGIRNLKRDYNLAPGDAERRGADIIARHLKDVDEIPLGRARAELKELGPQGMLADVGDYGTQSLTRGVVGQTGKARKTILGAFDKRNRGDLGRVSKQVTRNLGPGDYFAKEDEYLAKLTADAREAYTPAYAAHKNIATPGLSKLLQAREIKSAVREASEIANTEAAAGGTNWLSPVNKELEGFLQGNQRGQGLSLEAWDYVKRVGIDSLLSRPGYKNELTGRLNPKGSAVARLKRTLVGELDRATGGKGSPYKAARDRYGDNAEILTALRDGADFRRLKPAQIRKKMEELSVAGQEAYRNGASRAMLDAVSDTTDTASVARKLFNKDMSRKKIQALFPNTKAYLEFEKRINNEIKFFDTSNAIGAGSRTAPMLQEVEEGKRALGIFGTILGSNSPLGHPLLMAGIAKRAAQGALGPPRELNNAMARILTTRNRADQKRYFDMMEPAFKEEALKHPAIRAAILGTQQQRPNIGVDFGFSEGEQKQRWDKGAPIWQQ